MNITEFYNTYKNKYIGKNGGTTSYVQQVEPYGGQCVSLVQAFMLKVCGIPVKARGNAREFGDNLVASKMAVKLNLKDIKNGDIVVYPTLSAPYGHIGIYYNGKVFEQNPHKATLLPIRKTVIKIYRLNAYKQPTAVKSQFPKGFVKFAKPRTYQAKENMNIRNTYSITSKLHPKWSLFKKGQTFSCLGYVDNGNYRWMEISWNGRKSIGWIAEAPLKYAKEGRKKAEKYFYLKDITK